VKAAGAARWKSDAAFLAGMVLLWLGLIGLWFGFAWVPNLFTDPQIRPINCRAEVNPDNPRVAEVHPRVEASFWTVGSLSLEATLKIRQGTETRPTTVNIDMGDVTFWWTIVRTPGPFTVEVPLDPTVHPPRCEITEVRWS
jgi:hypothetical protein